MMSRTILQHLIVEHLAVLDGALQRLLGGDHTEACRTLFAQCAGGRAQASFSPKPTNAPGRALEPLQARLRSAHAARRPGRSHGPANVDPQAH
ncbi:MAG: hypothetical protein QM755_00045 [Luteolibacter sp.]